MDELESLARKTPTTRIVLFCMVITLLTGCIAQSGQEALAFDFSFFSDSNSSSDDPDQFTTVDCLLPGQLRRLGTRATYVTARRPTRTTAEDCAIRGGEYTVSDRADYKTALSTWLDAAQEGNPEAQYYVGTIYEKGPKGTPDYVLAAVWYQKAAQQGFSRAAMNLGRLHEQGLGVSKNPAEAFKWYAKASGIDESGLSMLMNQEASGRIQHLESTVAAKDEELAHLRQAMDKASQELIQLRQQLQQRSSNADQERQKLSELQQQYEALHQQLDDQPNQADQQAAQAHYEHALQQLRGKLDQRRTTLESQDQEHARLQQQIAALKKLAATQTHTIQTLEEGLTQKEQTVHHLESELSHTQQDLSVFTTDLQRRTNEAREARNLLQQTQDQYARAKTALDQALAQQVSQEVIAEYEQELQFLRTVQQDQQSTVESREHEVTNLKQTIGSLETALATHTQQIGTMREQAKGQIHTLETTLKHREQDIAHIQSNLSTVNQQLAQLEIELEHQTTAAEEKRGQRQQVEQHYQQRINHLEHALATSQEQAASNQHQEQLQTLHAQLESQQHIVKEQDDEVTRLHQHIASLESEAAQRAKELESTPVVDLGFKGPTIEIIDPPLILRRGIKLVNDTPIIPSKIGIARLLSGRVVAPAGLRILTINGLAIQVDSNGIFTMDLPPLEAGQESFPVEILAIDVQNKRAATKLMLTAEKAAETGPIMSEEDMAVFGNYYALVIGNDRYQHWNPLKNAVSDAQAVANILQNRYGFDVTFLKDATRRDTLKALNSFRKRLKENDNLLVYYAGHGHLESDIDRGYWIPVDAEIDDTSNWILTPSITDLLELMSAKHVLVVADSCFAGKLTRSSLAKLRPGLSEDARMTMLKTIATKRVRTALTSGGEHPVLDVGGSGHSVFTEAFLQILQENQIILETERLFWAIRTRVVKAASKYGMEQIPTYWPIQFAGHESLGDFIFVPQKS